LVFVRGASAHLAGGVQYERGRGAQRGLSAPRASGVGVAQPWLVWLSLAAAQVGDTLPNRLSAEIRVVWCPA
jgi:hypothetical protein